MPGGDRTGPEGMGQRTGKGLGLCGRGMRRVFGRCLGRGFRRGQSAGFEDVDLNEEQERRILEAEKAELESEIEKVKRKLDSFK